jgi:4-amino-4-deoxy-L-arabinose transferase-like glycosyltransferase
LFQFRRLAGLATLFVLFSPLFSYYSGVAMPDGPALALRLAALHFFLLYRDLLGMVSVILMAACRMQGSSHKNPGLGGASFYCMGNCAFPDP